jgi:toxin FitB
VSAIVLDTDVVSNILRDRLDSRLETRLLGRDLAITYVTLGELTHWVALRGWGAVRRRRLDNFLDGRAVLPGSKRVAETWGRMTALATQNGTPQPINDSWIAACCLTYRVPLATLNVKDYTYYVNAHGLELITA